MALPKDLTAKVIFTDNASLFSKQLAPKIKTIMPNGVALPMEGQILVNIDDMSMLKDIKKAISMVKGVGKITLPRRKRYSSYERSLRDLEEGRVYEAKDVDDLFRQCLG